MTSIGQILIYTLILLVGFVVGVGVTILYYEREKPGQQTAGDDSADVQELSAPPEKVIPPPVTAPVMPAAPMPAVAPRPASTPVASRPLPLTPTRPPAAPPEKPASMVEQIDAILQAMLEHSPLKDKAIHLVEDPRQGVVVWIGLEHYVGLDSVSDPQVTALLRAAVAEWERSASGQIKKL